MHISYLSGCDPVQLVIKLATHTFINEHMFFLHLLLPFIGIPVFNSLAMYEGQSKITESWLTSFYWVGSFG